jgi:hypothetical protein
MGVNSALPTLRIRWRVISTATFFSIIGILVVRFWHPWAFGGFGADFYAEALPPLRLLAHGHVLGFIDTSPAYLGSLLLRLPAILPALWLHASPQVVYVCAAVPALLAGPALCVLMSGVETPSRRRFAISPLLLLGINPLVWFSITFGHPEDVLTTALVIAAVVYGARDRGRAAGTLMALAVISKPWAAVAISALLVVPTQRRRTWLAFGTVLLAFWLPVMVARELTLGSGGAVASGVGAIWNGPQLLYWLGPTNPISQNAHVLIVLAGLLLGLLWFRLRGADDGLDRLSAGLWLLGLLFFIRFAFDPWDVAYYPLPVVMVLMAMPGRRWLLSITASIVSVVAVATPLFVNVSQSASARIFLAAALPALILLLIRVYAPPATFAVRHLPAPSPAPGPVVGA